MDTFLADCFALGVVMFAMGAQDGADAHRSRPLRPSLHVCVSTRLCMYVCHAGLRQTDDEAASYVSACLIRLHFFVGGWRGRRPRSAGDKCVRLLGSAEFPGRFRVPQRKASNNTLEGEHLDELHACEIRHKDVVSAHAHAIVVDEALASGWTLPFV